MKLTCILFSAAALCSQLLLLSDSAVASTQSDAHSRLLLESNRRGSRSRPGRGDDETSYETTDFDLDLFSFSSTTDESNGRRRRRDSDDSNDSNGRSNAGRRSQSDSSDEDYDEPEIANEQGFLPPAPATPCNSAYDEYEFNYSSTEQSGRKKDKLLRLLKGSRRGNPCEPDVDATKSYETSFGTEDDSSDDDDRKGRDRDERDGSVVGRFRNFFNRFAFFDAEDGF